MVVEEEEKMVVEMVLQEGEEIMKEEMVVGKGEKMETKTNVEQEEKVEEMVVEDEEKEEDETEEEKMEEMGLTARLLVSLLLNNGFSVEALLCRTRTFLSLFKPHLTERQKLELAAMQEVWLFTLDGEGSSRGGVKNGEFDDDDKNYILVQNEHFYYRFQLDRKIGQGGQSVVVRCLDHKTRTMVALKILAPPST
ncbi:unnamed protein product [Lampetra planeri]